MDEVSLVNEFGLRSIKVLDGLFNKARETDEFEYICSLLRIRGFEAPGWDPLTETNELFTDMMGILQAPLLDKTRLRVALLTYCHLTEVEAIYSVIENMLSISEGFRCSISPFSGLYRRTKGFGKAIPPSAKTIVNYLKEHAKNLDQKELCGVLEEMFDEVVRNSFYHSDYIIYGDEYRTRKGQFRRGNLLTSKIKLIELEEIINKGLGFYQGFMHCYRNHRLSYKEPKRVLARILPNNRETEAEILADPNRGVYGFKSKSSENTS